MLKENLERLFEFIALHIPSEQIMQAKKIYQKTTGEIYEDDKSYNSRMALFLEWYLLDNYTPGTQNTILESLTEENKTTWSQSHLEVCQDIANNIQALFEVKKVRDTSVTVLDLLIDEKYEIEEPDSKLIFRKNDIFQGRIVPHRGKWHFTGYFCFHPSKTQKYIKNEAKEFFILQRTWIKELTGLEKELSKFGKAFLKNSKYIEKIKTRIEHIDYETKIDELTRELLILEKNKRDLEISTQEIDNKIAHLKNVTIKLEGRRLISELINKLAYMNLKWERSRQIEISDIYKN
ncbi:MAG: hypothetical protein H8E42_13635 [Nitrospinae bacterium]|nr:hypothetical protein [Nitrospinota bacterium]MBL7019033.1 hypothetical protein [Nitrospinaceae bacterium]